MKELLLEDGRYPCTLRIGRSKAGAVLDLAGGQAPGGPLYDLPPGWPVDPAAGRDGTWSVQFPKPAQQLAVVRGRLRTNHQVVLLDAQAQPLLAPGTGSVRAQAALCGMDIAARGTPRFATVRFQVTGLTELAATHPVDVEWPTGRPAAAGGAERFTAVVRDRERRWLTPAGDTVALAFHPHVAPMSGYRFAVDTFPQLTVTGRPRTAQAWLEQYVRPATLAAGFALARSQQTAWVELSTGASGASSTVQVFAADITQQPYPAADPDLLACTLLTLEPGAAELPALLEYWRAAARQPDSFSGRTAAALGRGPRERFLGLTAALQSAHKDRHRGRRPSLGVQLRTLGGLLPGPLQQQVREGFAGLPQLHTVLDENTAEPVDAWAVAGKVRNNLAHGGSGTPPTDAQLAPLACLVHTLAAVVALDDLHLPTALLEQAVADGRWTVL